jgi:hypothetical protein
MLKITNDHINFPIQLSTESQHNQYKTKLKKYKKIIFQRITETFAELILYFYIVHFLRDFYIEDFSNLLYRDNLFI